MRDYSNHRCESCFNGAVGFIAEFIGQVLIKKYYCNKHYMARSSAQDSEWESIYYKQYGEADWFRKECADIVKKFEKISQVSLF